MVVLLLLGFAHLLVTNPTFGWSTVGKYVFSGDVLFGVLATLWLTAAAMLVGIVLGTLLAVMRLSPVWLASRVSFAYTWFFRGTPTLVQLFFWFNLSALFRTVTIRIPFGPTLYSAETNHLVTPTVAAILALGLAEAAYYAEIIRSGILSIDAGQVDAARAFGLTRAQTMRRIVLPQAMKVVIPPTGNSVIGMLKYTSIASVISVGELTDSVTKIYSVNFEVIPLLVVASIWYLIATSVLSVGQYYIERHYRPRGQGPVPTRTRRSRRLRSPGRPPGTGVTRFWSGDGWRRRGGTGVG